MRVSTESEDFICFNGGVAPPPPTPFPKAHIFECLLVEMLGKKLFAKDGGGVASSEELCHWGPALWFPKRLPVHSPCLLAVSLDVISQLLLQHHACLPAAVLLQW